MDKCTFTAEDTLGNGKIYLIQSLTDKALPTHCQLPMQNYSLPNINSMQTPKSLTITLSLS